MPDLLHMKKRPSGFLAHEVIDHDGEQFDYVNELHDILWRFVRAIRPSASGDLHTHVPPALFKLECWRAMDNLPD